MENKATAERTKVRPMVPRGEAVDGVIIFTTEDEKNHHRWFYSLLRLCSLLSSAEEAKEDMSFSRGFFQLGEKLLKKKKKKTAGKFRRFRLSLVYYIYYYLSTL